jgi:hypothetical protein
VLSRQLQEVSLKDPDAWLDDLLKKDKGIGECIGGQWKGVVPMWWLTQGGFLNGPACMAGEPAEKGQRHTWAW